MFIVLGFFAIRNVLGGRRDGVFSEVEYFPFMGIIVLTTVSLTIDCKTFKVGRRLQAFSLSIIGILIISVVAFKLIQYNFIESKETLVLIRNKAGANNVLTFDFKLEGAFKLTEHDLFGSTDYFGKYVRDGDTYRLLSSNYDGSLKLPQRGTVRQYMMYWENFDTMLVEKKAAYSSFKK
ncbi:MAG TPA: hypothetical protein VF609_02995 [Flavisolibacter sp.]